MLDSGSLDPMPSPPHPARALPRYSVNVLSSKRTLSSEQLPNRPRNRGREEDKPRDSFCLRFNKI